MTEERAKPKIGFLCKPGLDHFLNPVAEGVQNSGKYECERVPDKILFTDLARYDLVWAEWADDVAVAVSRNLPDKVKMVVRLHRYEAYTAWPASVVWERVSRLLLSDNSALYYRLIDLVPGLPRMVKVVNFKSHVDCKTFVLPNGNVREVGSIAWVGHLISRKNPFLLREVVDLLDDRQADYQLYIAGPAKEPMVDHYLRYYLEPNKRVHFVGELVWPKEVAKFLETKEYILSTSLSEGFPYALVEAMAVGCKPIIAHYPGAEHFPPEWTFNYPYEAANLLAQHPATHKKVREYALENHSLDNYLTGTIQLLAEVLDE